MCNILIIQSSKLMRKLYLAKKDLSYYRAENDDQMKELSRMGQEVRDRDEYITKLEGQIKRYPAQEGFSPLAKVQSDYNKAMLENERLTSEYNYAVARYKEVEANHAKTADALVIFTQKVVEANGEISKCQQTIVKQNAHIGERNQRINELEISLREKDSLYEEAAERVESLKRQLHSEEERYKICDRERGDNYDKLQSAVADRNTLQEEIDSLRDLIREKTETVVRLTNELYTVKEHLRAAEQQIV